MRRLGRDNQWLERKHYGRGVLWVLSISSKLCEVNRAPEEFWVFDTLPRTRIESSKNTRGEMLGQRAASIPLKLFLPISPRIDSCPVFASPLIKRKKRNPISADTIFIVVSGFSEDMEHKNFLRHYVSEKSFLMLFSVVNSIDQCGFRFMCLTWHWLML